LEDIGIDENKLLVIETKDLNRILKEKKVDKNRRTEITRMRRKLKNR
jgi:hypothetical protein